MSREKSLIKNTAILSFGTFLPKLAAFILLPILTGCLSKEEYGIYDLIVLAQWIFLPVVTLQIQTAAFRYLVDYRDNPERIRETITNILAFTWTVSAIALVLAFLFFEGLPSETKLLIVVYFFVDITACTFRQCVRGLGDNLRFSIAAILNSATSLVVAGSLLFGLGMGLTGCIIMLLSAVLVEAVYLFFRCELFRYLDYKTINGACLKELIGYSWPMVPNSMASWFIRAGNRLIILFFLGIEASAVFAVANKLPQIVNLVQHPFTLAWQESASLAIADKDSNSYYSSVFNAFFGFVAGSMALIVAATPFIYGILIRGDYSEAYEQMPILFLALFFSALATFLGGIYVAHMRTKSVGLTTAAAAAINLAITAVGVPSFGLYAASFASLICFLLLCVYRMVDVQRFASLSYNLTRYCILIAALIIMCILSYQQEPMLDVLNVLFGIALFIAANRVLLRKAGKTLRGKLGF